MKKTTFMTLVLVLISSLLFAGGISFKGFFPDIPGYKASLKEKPDEFDKSGILLAQTRFTHKSGTKWLIASYTLGTTIEGKPAMPAGYSMNQGGIIIQIKKIKGYISMYTYYTMQKKGNIIVYMPAHKKQKYNGMVTFSFTNTPRGEADSLIAKFNFKTIQKQMETLK